jgi:hypothetical protein
LAVVSTHWHEWPVSRLPSDVLCQSVAVAQFSWPGMLPPTIRLKAVALPPSRLI